MKRKEIKVGDHLVESRNQNWQQYGAHHVVVADAGEWYDRSAGITYYSGRGQVEQYTLEDGSKVDTSVGRRVADSKGQRKPTHVWVRNVGDDGSIGEPGLVSLTRLKATWVDYQAMRARADEAGKAAKQREEVERTMLLTAANQADHLISLVVADVPTLADNLPEWATTHAGIDRWGKVENHKGTISKRSLAILLDAAYEAGVQAGKDEVAAQEKRQVLEAERHS